MSGGTLILGAGQAGAQLAITLRDLDPDQPITLVGAEPVVPYQRPPLSKGMLTGRVERAGLALRSAEFFERHGIRLVLDERIVGIAPAAGRDGGRAVTERGGAFEYDRLALTVGTRPRRLGVPGAALTGVGYLRDVEDAERLRGQLVTARRVVVIGGGFIGLEVAAVARGLGAEVAVVEAADRLMGRAVPPMISAFYRDAHTRRGVDVRLEVGVREIRGSQGRVTGVELTDGSVLAADVVLIGIGVVPRTELAEQLGAECDGGILVDEFARTSVSGVVAAGDCTAMPGGYGGRIRLESVQNAIGQAKVAARTLSGELQPYTDVPTFWSDQFDLKLQMVGLAEGYDDYEIRGDMEQEKFAVHYYREGSLIAGHAVGRLADYLEAKRALELVRADRSNARAIEVY